MNNGHIYIFISTPQLFYLKSTNNGISFESPILINKTIYENSTDFYPITLSVASNNYNDIFVAFNNGINLKRFEYIVKIKNDA